MSSGEDRKRGKAGRPIARREFLKESAGLSVLAVVGLSGPRALAAKTAEVPLAKGYLLVDPKKCQGCLTCMLACSMAHEGKENLSLARIQVLQDPFQGFPQDLSMAPCRQCADPVCVTRCPTGAMHADPEHGFVRTVDPTKCIGCKTCVKECPFPPSRSIWNPQIKRAHKCDLCAGAKFFDEAGGPAGKQACREACPLNAIALVIELPVQEGYADYQVNLRKATWRSFGYSPD
ncbi:MAG: hypothetical protein A2V67_01005 [Deltaproteobacteria bacterium RBG_13_61_14]|nr:MAG: hypothetical protein A2V67_01005 [Deltaproteobacteria bacterium RBG_13_61_14]